MLQKHRLQQGFCQNHARTSYSWSPVPGRTGFSSVHWLLSAKPTLWQTPYMGTVFGVSKTSISGFVAVGPQKRGQFLDLEFAPFPIEGWFWGPLIGLWNGPRNSAFFSSFCPIIWGSIFGQHGRSCNDFLRARPASPPKGLLAQSVLAH